MKLKKIASLALAGVMALTMLAGCATTNDTGDDTNGVKPPVDDVTPASYSQTILDGTNGNTKSLMTAKDSDMLSDAVVAAGASVNEADDIHELIKIGKSGLQIVNYKNRVGHMVVDGFGDNLAEDVNLQISSWNMPVNTNDRYAALYVCDTGMNETQMNIAISGVVNGIMTNYHDHLNATDIDYTLSVAKAQVGTRANGVVLVGVMIEVSLTHAA